MNVKKEEDDMSEEKEELSKEEAYELASEKISELVEIGEKVEDEKFCIIASTAYEDYEDGEGLKSHVTHGGYHALLALILNRINVSVNAQISEEVYDD